MSLLMLAGLVGSVLYSGYTIKNDIQAEMVDKKTKPTFNHNTNQNKIRNNFKDICKRSGIKLKNGNPVNDNKINTAIEYLQYQGYTDNDIKYFKKIFNNKLKQQQSSDINIMKLKNERLKYKLQNNPANELVVLRRTVYKSCLSPQDRIDKLLENELWNKIVDHQTYIRTNNGKWEEIWTLKVPNKFFTDISKEELYKNICKLQNVEYTI